MNPLSNHKIGLILGTLVLTSVSVCADQFGVGGNAFTIEFVTVGNAGNANDAGGSGLYSSQYGAVGYEYRMGIYEIPEKAILKATNGGLLNVTGGGWSADQPATNITWFEAAAFVNWLNTSTGHQAAYQLTGETTLALWSSGDAWQLGGENLFRHKDAYYFLPSEDEWYKAAYHQNNGVTADYSDYATGSNTAPVAVASGTGAGTAVYSGAGLAPAAVDAAGGLSAYGTMGQNGNVWEWHESALDGINDSSTELRTIRGGLWSLSEVNLRSSERGFGTPAVSDVNVGFRIASVVPEPSSAALLVCSGFALLGARRRRSDR